MSPERIRRGKLRVAVDSSLKWTFLVSRPRVQSNSNGIGNVQRAFSKGKPTCQKIRRFHSVRVDSRRNPWHNRWRYSRPRCQKKHIRDDSTESFDRENAAGCTTRAVRRVRPLKKRKIARAWTIVPRSDRGNRYYTLTRLFFSLFFYFVLFLFFFLFTENGKMAVFAIFFCDALLLSFLFLFPPGKRRKHRDDSEQIGKVLLLLLLLLLLASSTDRPINSFFTNFATWPFRFRLCRFVSLASLNSRSRPPLFTRLPFTVDRSLFPCRRYKPKKSPPFDHSFVFVNGNTWNTTLRFGISKFIRYMCVYVTTEFTSVLCKNWTFDRKGGKSRAACERKKTWKRGKWACARRKRNETKTIDLLINWKTMNARNRGTKVYTWTLPDRRPFFFFSPLIAWTQNRTRDRFRSTRLRNVGKLASLTIKRNLCVIHTAFATTLSLSLSLTHTLSLCVYRVRVLVGAERRDRIPCTLVTFVARIGSVNTVVRAIGRHCFPHCWSQQFFSQLAQLGDNN